MMSGLLLFPLALGPAERKSAGIPGETGKIKRGIKGKH